MCCAGKPATHCGTHRQPGQIDIANKRCEGGDLPEGVQAQGFWGTHTSLQGDVQHAIAARPRVVAVQGGSRFLDTDLLISEQEEVSRIKPRPVAHMFLHCRIAWLCQARMCHFMDVHSRA